MSKIYEALLRAEQDRITADAQQTAVTKPHSQPVAALATEAPAQDLSQIAFAQTASALASAVPAAPANPPTVHPIPVTYAPVKVSPVKMAPVQAPTATPEYVPVSFVPAAAPVLIEAAAPVLIEVAAPVLIEAPAPVLIEAAAPVLIEAAAPAPAAPALNAGIVDAANHVAAAPQAQVQSASTAFVPVQTNWEQAASYELPHLRTPAVEANPFATEASQSSVPLPDSGSVKYRWATDSPITYLDMNEVKRFSWKPSLYHLPALEERGRSVEQFRSLRSRMHEFRDLNTLKSILVSSGLPQEGKSFIAANLAISFARHEASRVLLIDGDMRRSSLHQLLGTHSEPGLSEYLAGKASVLEIMQQASVPPRTAAANNGLSSLTFIPAGADTNTAADLSGNYRFDDLIKLLAPHFDWIVVDSSPVNLVADGVNLARACDGVLLVARAGVTKFEAAQRALIELKASNILGFVLNAVTKLPQSGGYYGYDSYDTYDSLNTKEPEPAVAR